ncbi:hypothetical protein AAFF_G00141310 [Aldrovandia affinis]|uniref:Uncharacterized protein n=1 Tax=Aldrovandia affinis TaxID=143900 RepID=A0AAD7X2T7_9TELE|nr:hypothetical protein AAFF_G00141310 [Aldrovandia affinis]
MRPSARLIGNRNGRNVGAAAKGRPRLNPHVPGAGGPLVCRPRGGLNAALRHDGDNGVRRSSRNRGGCALTQAVPELSATAIAAPALIGDATFQGAVWVGALGESGGPGGETAGRGGQGSRATPRPRIGAALACRASSKAAPPRYPRKDCAKHSGMMGVTLAVCPRVAAEGLGPGLPQTDSSPLRTQTKVNTDSPPHPSLSGPVVFAPSILTLGSSRSTTPSLSAAHDKYSLPNKKTPFRACVCVYANMWL